MSRAKNYVSALDKRPAIHSPLCPPLCSSLSLSLSFFNYRPLVSIQFETIVTTFSRPFSIYRPSPEILSARSFWLLRFFAYPDSRLFHLLYRWIESRFDYTYGYWKSLFFFLLKKFLSSFRAREKVDRFRLPSFWKIGGEGRRKNINCERYVCVRRMIERRDIYLFSLSLFHSLFFKAWWRNYCRDLPPIIVSNIFRRNMETLFRSGSGSPYQPERS